MVMPNFCSSISNVQSMTGVKSVSKVYFFKELMESLRINLHTASCVHVTGYKHGDVE